jgi:predicted nucleotidyltransferase component of viral defense system
MLTSTQLFLIQNKFQTTNTNVLREYLQHLFLASLYKTPKAQKILFKGGTAYRIAYKSPRFSEDLDFSSSEISTNEIEKTIFHIMEDFSNNGLSCDISVAKKTTGGYLAKLLTSFGNEKVPISVQISQREKVSNGYDIFEVVNEYIPTYQALLLPTSEMMGEKIQAALTRSKPRDFYDIYFLLRNGLLDYTLKSQLSKVKDMLHKKKIRFSDELSHFLPKSMKLVADNFPKALLIEIEKYL